jgi:hypothetical protein
MTVRYFFFLRYETVEGFDKDMSLVWENAKLYNQPGSGKDPHK